MRDSIQKLKDYQYSQGDTFITPSDFRELKRIEANDSNDVITLYRGINCMTEQIRNAVLDAIDQNRFTQGALTASFSSDKDIATEFSFSEMSNFPTPEIMKAQELREERLDYMTGYSGLVVAATYMRSDVLDVGAIITSSEMEFLVPTSVKPLDVKITEVVPYYRQINESDIPMHKHLQDAISAKDKSVLLHIAAAWSDSLSAPNKELLASGVSFLYGDDMITFLKCLPSEMRNSQEILKGVYSPTVLEELSRTETIEPDAARHRMRDIVEERMAATDSRLGMLRFSQSDFKVMHEMGAINSKGMDKAIGELLRTGEHDKAIDMIAAYGYSNSKVVSAMFKKEVTKHQQEIADYNASVVGKERITDNTIVIGRNTANGYDRITQTHTIAGGSNALFRYTSYHSKEDSKPESLGCSLIGNENMFKLMSQYPNFTKADQIRADIILEDTVSAIQEIKSIPDADLPKFDGTTIQTLTKYPNTPFRSHLIDSLLSDKLTGVHKMFSLLNVMNDDNQTRNAIARKLESNLMDIAKGMGAQTLR
nr:hypothetical protein [Vibrio splendidus]MCC4880324.1 hypothetical protein [Vibrio splendidus]